ncbi:MAG TPA: DUF5808 domain-containing protein [Candidatus Acidoferrales bacterium]|jgi:uncharacterized membrane protein|nr:DUF5808 domain-containing protein [Candidatus Acidoferrales bacterium]
MSDNPLAQMLWFLIAEMGMIGAMLYLLPTLTRRDIFFAVTVPADFRGSEEAKAILRRFRAALLVHSVVAVALTAAGFVFHHLWLLLAGVYWQCFGAFLAFLSGRRKVLPHAAAPSQVHEAVLAPREPGPLGHRMLQVGPFAIMTATCLYLYARWESLPVRFPVHWGIDGKPNRWASRSFLGVYGAMLTGFVICGGMALLAYAILHWSRQVRATGAAAVNEDKFRNTQLGILLGAEYFIAVLFSWIALMPLRQSQEMGASMAVILLATLAFVGVVFVAVIHTGQGGANLAHAGAGATGSIPEAAPIGDRTPDRCWKGGMIYYNPDDPAVLVEKRFGIGYTLNFGNGRSWLVLGGIVLVPLILALVLTHTH